MNNMYEFIRLGRELSKLEVALAYALVPAVLTLGPTADVFRANARRQFLLFALVVQFPTLLTSKMSYVDIGWPTGLVVLAATAFFDSAGWFPRRALVTGMCAFHGARMALAALYFFFPYNFPNGDLPRYQHAKHRFITIDGGDPKLWPIKQQFETLAQAFANSFVLAVPILLTASNPATSFHPVELVGAALWCASWVFESIADGQKLKFLLANKETELMNPKNKHVLGMPPFDTSEYWCWTATRHPNYLGEFLCWCSYSIFALPSALAQESPAAVAVAFVGIALVVRLFYDCLVCWTGAAPAEFRSVEKRPLYREYQKKTPVLFPFEFPGVDARRRPGWPHASSTTADAKRD